MQRLQEFLRCTAGLTRPEIWRSCRDRIEEENRHLLRLANNRKVSIYGVNTLTGHRDNEHVDSSSPGALQEDILNTHAIGRSPFHSDYAARCIAYARLYTWSAGHSGISPELFNAVSDLAVSAEFRPDIPAGCTYSSGDVIPAAHWAKAVLDTLKNIQQYRPQPGDVMALINGGFVHTGYAASLVRKLRQCWSVFIAVSAIVHDGTKANRSNLYLDSDTARAWTSHSIQYLESVTESTIGAVKKQDPVSLRALPQVVDTLCSSIEDYMKEVDLCLSRPSGNPLFDVDFEFSLSQASFLAPVLTIKTEGVIESVLFAMWSMVGRMNHWLSGVVSGVPRDASNEHSPLGLIQYPKLMMASLEEVRMKFGRRVLSSGSQTSYGTEDLWTNGVMTAHQLDQLLDEFFRFCATEVFIASYIDKQHGLAGMTGKGLLETCSDCLTIEEVETCLSASFEDGAMGDISALFPISA